MKPTVVLVHGLWMTGLELFFLRRWLEKDAGFATVTMHYRSLNGTIDEATRRLAAAIRALDAPSVHLVGHSMGGRVIYRMLERGLVPEARIGRAVFLGTPCVDCRCGSTLGRGRLGRLLLGRAGAEEFLDSPAPTSWGFRTPLGIIAGDHAFGVGRLLGTVPDGPSDGTVLVEETRLPGASAHLVVHATHTGLWLSPRVAREVGGFLDTGRFGPVAAQR